MKNLQFVVAASLLALNAVAEIPSGWMTRFCTNSPSITDPEMAVKGTMVKSQSFVPSGAKVAVNKSVKLASANAATPLMATASSLPASVTLDLPMGFTESDYARIKELARALDYNWDKCYRYVRDNIVFTPYGGILRGPERTLLDKEATAIRRSCCLRSCGHLDIRQLLSICH